SPPKARATKWGLPSMPDLKSTLNASLARATSMIAKHPEASDVESEDGAFKEGSVGEGVLEGDGEREPVVGDEADRQAISKKLSFGKTASLGMPGMLGTRHGMLSLKESLQARLTGTSGKPRTEHESGQDEGTAEQQSDHDGARRESGAGVSAVTLPGRQALDTTTVEQAGLENIFSDPDDAQSMPEDTSERKPISRESSRRGSLGEGDRRAEKRESRSRADTPSPLRSLLQDDNSEEDHEHQREEAEDGEGKGDHEHVGDNPAGSGHARWSPAHTLSVPDVASSVKEAAARVKSTLSSPKFSGSLKSFRWNRHKEDSFSNEPSPQPASTDDSADDIAPMTPTAALEAEKTGSYDEEEGSLGRGSSPSPPLAATALLVTMFRASGLPEMLAKRMFGRTKKDGAQDPYVLLKFHDCEAVTSTAQRKGQEWTWGNADEGEVVEIPIPLSKVPDAGLESSKLIVELRNKATDVREKGALLSSVEILLADCLGRKAAWADLEATGSPGGRVKLSVALTERAATPILSKRGSHKDSIGVDNTCATTAIVAVEKNDVGADLVTTIVNNAYSIDDTSLASSDIGVDLRDRRESKADASRRSLGSFPSDGDSQKAPDREESGWHPISGAVQGQSETGDEVVAPEGGATNAAAAAAATSSDDISDEGKKLPVVIERAEDTRRTSSKLLKGGGAEAQATRPGDNIEQTEEEQGDRVSNLEEKIKGHEPVRRSSQAASDVLDKGDRPIQGEETRRLSGAGIEAVSQGTAADSSSAHVDPADSLETPALPPKERQNNSPNDLEAGVGDDIEENPNVPTADVTDSHAAANSQGARLTQEAKNNDEMEQIVDGSTMGSVDSHGVASAEDVRSSLEVEKKAIDGDVHGLSRRLVGRTATALDLAASGPISDPQVSPTTKKELTRVDSLTTNAQTEKRLVRAREIARRRRRMISACEPVGRRGRMNAPPGVQTADSFSVVTPEEAKAVTTIQGACRGRAARRRLRARQRAAIKIQAVCRGYVSRRECTGLRARTKRAKFEEKRARQRRSRMAATQKELNLLRRTPTRDLTRIFALRAEAMATRIQRFWRQYGGEPSVRGGSGEEALILSLMHFPSTTCYRSFVSDRSAPSSLTLEALRRRVETRQRTRGRYRDQGKLCLINCGPYTHVMHNWEYLDVQVSRLTGAIFHSELERVAAVKRRSHRLANFRRLQDQLLHPPKLDSNSPDKNDSSAGQVGDAAFDVSRRRWTLDKDVGKDWSLAEQPKQRDRAQRAHVLAVEASNVEGNKPWATSLPADVGFGQIVDIRRVLPSWSTASGRRGGRRAHTDDRDYGNGYPSERGTGAGEQKFSSDEASLWWYTYACTGKGGEAGVPKTDHHFPELLERGKTNLKHRREHAEREEQKHRLTVARKRQNIVEKVIHQQHQQRVANRPSPHYSRHRVTEAQWVAAVVLQACVRGFLERKKVAVLRAEMRVFGALQVLVNELRQPELDEVSIADPMHSLAGILAEHS
ncbi:unnamed protein product, partial [Laminaria digitata]